jgi:hypothetical protein
MQQVARETILELEELDCNQVAVGPIRREDPNHILTVSFILPFPVHNEQEKSYIGHNDLSAEQMSYQLLFGKVRLDRRCNRLLMSMLWKLLWFVIYRFRSDLWEAEAMRGSLYKIQVANGRKNGS